MDQHRLPDPLGPSQQPDQALGRQRTQTVVPDLSSLNLRAARGAQGAQGAQVRSHTLLDAVTEDELKAIVAKLVEMAKGGDLPAMKEVLDRTLGKPPAAVTLDVSAHDDVCGILLDEDWYGNAGRLSANAPVSGQDGPCE